jgi:actin related protein 2/3 complex subunit 1A/1B
MFRQMDLKGQTQADTQLKTVHQNTISTIRVYEDVNGSVQKLSSKLPSLYGIGHQTNTPLASGVDGRVVIWTI